MKENWISLFAEAVFPKLILNMFISLELQALSSFKKKVKVLMKTYSSLYIKII